MQIQVTIYPAHMTQETASWKYLQDAAARFANELTGKIREAYPDAELDIDIRPNETGPNGGVSCEDRDIQEHVQHLYDQTFNEGNFWPEITGPENKLKLIDFLYEAEKRLLEVLEEQEDQDQSQHQEYSVLGHSDGWVHLIPSSAGFNTNGVQFYWDGWRKNNLFDSEIEVLS